MKKRPQSCWERLVAWSCAWLVCPSARTEQLVISLQNFTFCWPCIMQWFLVNDQRDAQIPFYVFIFIYNSLHVSSTSCSSSERQIVSIQSLVTVTLCRWPCRVHKTRPPTQSDSYQRLYWHNLSLLMMSTMCSKHVESSRWSLTKNRYFLSTEHPNYCQRHSLWGSEMFSCVRRCSAYKLLCCGRRQNITFRLMTIINDSRAPRPVKVCVKVKHNMPTNSVIVII